MRIQRPLGMLSGLLVASLLAFNADAQVVQRRIPMPVTPAPAPAPDPASPPGSTPPAVTPEASPPAAAPPRDIGAGSAMMPKKDKSAGFSMGVNMNMMAGWDRLPGCAKRISIAALTHIYVTGCGDGPDTPIFHWNQDHWDQTPVTGVSVVAVYNLAQGGPDSTAPPYSGPIAVTTQGISTGGLQERSAGGGWQWGILGPQGDHWGGQVVRAHCIAATDDSGECAWQSFGNVYMKRIGAGVTDAIAWAVGEDGQIYRQVNQGVAWIGKPGCATAIANGGKEQVWVIGCDEPDAQGNRGIYRWNGNAFTRVAGLAREIAVQSDGKAWVITGDGGIWRRR